MNEKITEELVRNKFTQYGYYNDINLIVDEQKSTIPQIDKLLQTASKKGSGKGFPEFIIKSKEINGFVCVVECKADITKHQSKTLNKYSDYAVDGAKLYADYLSKGLDVLFIGVSGLNNGVEMFGSSQHINEGNTITIGAEGIKAFYQKDNFIT